ncbi:hypothetical protein [Nocardioides campestrisoli]|uniref:hypothetical protein n=1 Tax=Nocardioides campestrisoli TaxID=2736757 RepID=UPI00163D4A78|nr:hypothetical protein [Nocardioides campestrisoli]
MSSSRPRRIVTLAAAAVLLGGCGGSVSDSGTAATVGDEAISVAEVDNLAKALCADSEDQLAEAGQEVPMAVVRQSALNILVVTGAAQQIADKYEVEPGADYERARSAARQQAKLFDEEQQDGFVVAASADALIQGVMTATGEQLLIEEGVAKPTEEEAIQRGSETFWSWPEVLDLDVNPVFDVEEVQGQLRPAAGADQVSFPVSATAQSASDPEQAASGLPAYLRCG